VDKDFYKYKKIVAERDRKAKANFNRASKQQLIKCVISKLRTTFIGDLDEFEKAFGYLWGIDEEEISPEQEKLKELWLRVRNRILDKGNDHIRNFKKQMGHYNIEWKPYHINLQVKEHRYED
jgi:hypothetical protein